MQVILKISLLSLGLLFLAGGFGECTKQKAKEQAQENKMTDKTIEQVLKEHTDHLMSISGVVGTGIGESQGKSCIMVFVIEDNPELRKKIPTQLDGFNIVIQETGEIRALEKE